MARHLSATAVCCGPASTIVHQSGGAPATWSDTGGGEGDPDLALLRTVQEDTVWSAGNGSNNSVCDSVLHGLTPCSTSFLASEGHALRRTASERFMKQRDNTNSKDVPWFREGGGEMANDNAEGGGFLCGRPSSSCIGTPATTTAGKVVEAGFPPLVRRRTFTTDTATSAPAVDKRNDCSVRGGRVPMSMSEDNMLALLARHPLNSSSPAPDIGQKTVQDTINCKSFSLQNHNKATSFSGGGGTGGGATTTGAGILASSNPNGAATGRARRNSVVMK